MPPEPPPAYAVAQAPGMAYSVPYPFPFSAYMPQVTAANAMGYGAEPVRFMPALVPVSSYSAPGLEMYYADTYRQAASAAAAAYYHPSGPGAHGHEGQAPVHSLYPQSPDGHSHHYAVTQAQAQAQAQARRQSASGLEAPLLLLQDVLPAERSGLDVDVAFPAVPTPQLLDGMGEGVAVEMTSACHSFLVCLLGVSKSCAVACLCFVFVCVCVCVFYAVCASAGLCTCARRPSCRPCLYALSHYFSDHRGDHCAVLLHLFILTFLYQTLPAP